MLKMLRTNKKAQNTAEYAILIALVVGAVIAMQTYAQRAIQGRLRDASVKFRDDTSVIGNTLQYEPYYTNTSKQVDKAQTDVDTFNSQTRSDVSKTKTDSYVDRVEYQNDAVESITDTTTGSGSGVGM